MADLDPQLVARLPPDIARAIAATAIRLGGAGAWRDETASLEAALPGLVSAPPGPPPEEYVILARPLADGARRVPSAVAVARHADPVFHRPAHGVLLLSGRGRWHTGAAFAAFADAGRALRGAAARLPPRGAAALIHARRVGDAYRYRVTERTAAAADLGDAARAFAGW